jgi:hypothetical protein
VIYRLLLLLILFVVAHSAFAYRNGIPEAGLPAIASFRANGSRCNGTFILSEKGENDVMLTARHCVANADPQSVIVLSTGGKTGTRAVGFLRPDGITSTTTKKNLLLSADLAFVLFPSGTADGVLPLALEPIGPGAPVLSAAWNPNGSGKFSGTNKVLSYNYRAGDEALIGYILSEKLGGIPDIKGESGSPLVSDEGVVGVLTGTIDLGKVSPKWSGLGALYMAVHAEEMVAFLANAKMQLPGPFKPLDFTDFMMFPSPSGETTDSAAGEDEDDKARMRLPDKEFGDNEIAGAKEPVVPVERPREVPADPLAVKTVPLSRSLRAVLGGSSGAASSKDAKPSSLKDDLK